MFFKNKFKKIERKLNTVLKEVESLKSSNDSLRLTVNELSNSKSDKHTVAFLTDTVFDMKKRMVITKFTDNNDPVYNIGDKVEIRSTNEKGYVVNCSPNRIVDKNKGDIVCYFYSVSRSKKDDNDLITPFNGFPNIVGFMESDLKSIV